MSFFQKLKQKIRGENTTEELIKMGLRVGKNFNRMGGGNAGPVTLLVD